MPAARAAAPPTSFASGRYQLERFIGEGSRKRVYMASDTRLGRSVALAVIKTEGLDDEMRLRVHREARAMARLDDHANIVTIHDVGEEHGQLFMVSEFMAGGDLERRLAQAPERTLHADEALHIAQQICGALEHCHSRSVIHRDVKPGNVWFTADGVAKLGDLGLALTLDRSRITQEGVMLGTPAYMPPEQALSGEFTSRSDLYSLGAMLYEMVTGRPPFVGDDVVAIISQHLNTPPVAPSWHNDSVPRPLEELILRLLAKDPAGRPESPAAVGVLLESIRSGAAGVAQPAETNGANPLERLAGGVFVGREVESERLRTALDNAASGRGRSVVLSGEPGIGKTRTAEELATYAGMRGVQVLWGRCHEDEGAPAYWPWRQIIRAYVHDRDPQELSSEMGSGAAYIAQVVSEVRQHLPALPPRPPVEGDQARFQLFDSIATFLRNASIRRPLMLVLDDVQWADPSSLLLLEFVAREVGEARVLIVVTFRDVEPNPPPPLQHALAELARATGFERLSLAGLSGPDVGRFIELTTSRSTPPALVDAVYRETEGNPFFVSEVVRLLESKGRLERAHEVTSWSIEIPQGVRQVIGRRLRALTPQCHDLLRSASAIGREFDLQLLARVSGLALAEVLERLEEAHAARVLEAVVDAAGRYRFAHALVHDTLYDDLGATRIALHLKIGETLEPLSAEHSVERLAELAHHFVQAGAVGGAEKAIGYLRTAGARVREQLAYEAAIEHYERALMLEADGARDDRLRCELTLALGECHARAGSSEKAAAFLWESVDLARRLGAGDLMCRAALAFPVSLGGLAASVSNFVDEPLIDLLDEVITAQSEESEARVRLLARMAVELYFTDRRAQRETLSREAVEMARRVGSATTLGYALMSRFSVLWAPETARERLDISSEAIRLSDQTSDKELAFRGHLALATARFELGDIAGFDASLETLQRIGPGLKQPAYQWPVALACATRALFDGRLDDAERLANEALAVGQEGSGNDALQAFGAQIGSIRQVQGRTQEMEPIMRAMHEQHPDMTPWLVGLLAVAGDLGNPDEAEPFLERLAPDDFASVRRDLFWLANISVISNACAQLGDLDRSAVLYELLLPYRDYNVVAAGVISYGSTGRFLGLLAAVLSRWDEAEAHFEHALVADERMGARLWLANTQYDFARMLLSRLGEGDHERAIGLLNSSLETARKLALPELLDRGVALKLEIQGIDPGGVQRSIYAVATSLRRAPPDLYEHASPDGTVTLMFSDMEGFTEMTERLGDKAAHVVIQRHNAIVREQLQIHAGYEVELQGDGFLLAFKGARSALLCAMGIQRALAAHNDAHADQPIRVRIGLHTGEAIKDADKFFGRTVIQAYRIADQARSDEILVSSLLKELVQTSADLRFGEAREIELKGLSGKHLVFAAEWR